MNQRESASRENKDTCSPWKRRGPGPWALSAIQVTMFHNGLALGTRRAAVVLVPGMRLPSPVPAAACMNPRMLSPSSKLTDTKYLSLTQSLQIQSLSQPTGEPPPAPPVHDPVPTQQKFTPMSPFSGKGGNTSFWVPVVFGSVEKSVLDHCGELDRVQIAILVLVRPLHHLKGACGHETGGPAEGERGSVFQEQGALGVTGMLSGAVGG